MLTIYVNYDMAYWGDRGSVRTACKTYLSNRSPPDGPGTHKSIWARKTRTTETHTSDRIKLLTQIVFVLAVITHFRIEPHPMCIRSKNGVLCCQAMAAPTTSSPNSQILPPIGSGGGPWEAAGRKSLASLPTPDDWWVVSFRGTRPWKSARPNEMWCVVTNKK